MRAVIALALAFTVGGTAHAGKKTAQSTYDHARGLYYELKSSPDKQQLRHHWTHVIEAFEEVVLEFPKSPLKVRARYTIAELYNDLYAISRTYADYAETLRRYRLVEKNHASTSFADDSMWQRASLMATRDATGAKRVMREILKRYPKGDMAPRARAWLRIERVQAPSVAQKTTSQKPTKPKPAAPSLDESQEATPKIAQTDANPAAPKDAEAVATESIEALIERGDLFVVLDPGHGGKDTGAVGVGGVREKDVVLAIAKETKKKLEAAGVRVSMTRTNDTYLSLEERTKRANSLGADAFISIHANAAPKRSVNGIETYFLDVTRNRYAKRLAALESKSTHEDVSALEFILADLTTKANTTQSRKLAGKIQQRLVQGAKAHNTGVRDLGVKGALFYVLLGARMPAVLVETSFVSNPTEAKLLKSGSYQRTLASAIAESVMAHFENPVAVAQGN